MQLRIFAAIAGPNRRGMSPFPAPFPAQVDKHLLTVPRCIARTLVGGTALRALHR